MKNAHSRSPDYNIFPSDGIPCAKRIMKNKIFSAMLLGISASVAMPGAAAFAAEAPVETAVTEEAITEIQASEPLDKVAEMNAYAQDEEAKKSDTPEGFGDDISTLPIMVDTFGQYADMILDYICSSDLNTNSLYDCEMDIVSKTEELMSAESEDAVKAAKYNIALLFENAYGENAFQAGRDIRRSIIGGKDEEFAECSTISEADSVYSSSNGVTNAPINFLKEETKEIGSDAETDVLMESAEEMPTGEVSTDMPDESLDETQMETQVESPEGAVENITLSSYVKGIVDIDLTVGEEVPSPSVTFDSAYVQSVSLDSSVVDTTTEGTYTVTYIITGIDGSTENVDMKCNVKKNDSVDALRQEMCNKVDEMAEGKITEEGFIEEWKAKAEEAKAAINSMTAEEEMQSVLDDLQKVADEIISKQQLSVAKKGYIEVFNSYLNGFKFETEAEQTMADSIAKETIDNINNAETVQAAADALQAGKDKISAIGGQEESIDKLKESAKEEVEELKSTVDDPTTMTENIYNLIITRIDECSTAKEIESITNSAKRVFTDIQKGIDGDMSAMEVVYKDLKGLSTDPDTTSTIDLVIKKGSTKDLNDAEYRVKDICSAITMPLDEFKDYLFERAGQEVSGTTKAEAYTEFINIMESGPSENELSEAKESAKAEIETKLNEISGDEEVESKKEELKDELFASIDAATSVDEVKEKLTDALKRVAELKEEVEAGDSLKEKKEEAKAYFDKVVSKQTDDTLKAEIQKLAEEYSLAVDSAQTESEIDAHKKAFDDSVAAVIKAYEENKELAETMSNTIKKIMALSSNVDSQYVSDEMKMMIDDAIEDVKHAKSAEECNDIYSDVKDRFNKAYIDTMRMTYEDKLDELLKNSDITDEKYREQAVTVINKQKENLKQATNETSMENCYKLAQKQIDKIVELQKNESKLKKAKENAIAELKRTYPNPSENETKILNSYVNKINDAKSQEEIDRLVKECKDSITRSQQTGGASSDTNEDIVKKREEVISALTNMYSEMEKNKNISDENKAEAKKILDSYIQQINEATTVDEIQSLFEKGKEALSKYGGNPNDAVPNPSTNTTAGGEDTPEAGEKKAEMLSTGKVKTGDTNVGVIAAAGTAMIAAIGVAVLAIRRFFNRD